MSLEMLESNKVIEMEVDVVNLEGSLTLIHELSFARKGAYVCVSNVHMCMETFDDLTFKNIVNSADMVIPDGRPISWAQKLLGSNRAEQVRGQDIMNALCASSGEKNLNIGFYGGSSDLLLERVVIKLKESFPSIQVTYKYSPPFRALTEEENKAVVDHINDCKVNILFVGIGCPKQEKWMASNKESLNCVMLGVGAAFDFIAGSKKHAPTWIQYLGFEWLFRLCSEPRRLWKRYLKQNPRFLYHFTKQLVQHKLTNRCDID
ncbi:WecB/TagA/CpsF family glycosyltransferase [Thalassotalea litorea]|uniref:WecB/TagA/CpsF family glycosyltransferase n=1 Tax=Thalassotalea litorea TaxID=2020715 RepID=A0A5R9IHQ4_9GAMM|nr:WecB/TagA/CpsF family glycosyltransferase [Thalassotalea litorea]TLU65070.1 WecB/TagA/CpsF family glycosyltransferase [Thalassotalea litorea]